MWYNEDGVDSGIDSAQLASYSYWGEESKGENCGTYWFYEGVEIVAGTWHDLEMYLKMNDEGVVSLMCGRLLWGAVLTSTAARVLRAIGSSYACSVILVGCSFSRLLFGLETDQPPCLGK